MTLILQTNPLVQQLASLIAAVNPPVSSVSIRISFPSLKVPSFSIDILLELTVNKGINSACLIKTWVLISPWLLEMVMFPLQYTDSGNFYLFVEKNTSEKERESIVTITHEKDKNLKKHEY